MVSLSWTTQPQSRDAATSRLLYIFGSCKAAPRPRLPLPGRPRAPAAPHHPHPPLARRVAEGCFCCGGSSGRGHLNRPAAEPIGLAVAQAIAAVLRRGAEQSSVAKRRAVLSLRRHAVCNRRGYGRAVGASGHTSRRRAQRWPCRVARVLAEACVQACGAGRDEGFATP